MPDPLSTMILTDVDLPGTWKDADSESMRGQRLVLQLTGGKIAGGLLAAGGGVFSWHVDRVDIAALIILIGFLSTLVCEVISWAAHAEKLWYEGRAAAESIKTLAWRYAVCADPFLPSMNDREAEDLLRDRILSVTNELSAEITFSNSNTIASEGMTTLRNSCFANRRGAYIKGRIIDQKSWYTKKATSNRRQARIWRSTLVIFEALAFALACSRVAGGWSIDFAGLFAATIAAGTAWVAVKQFSSLTSAYSLAANELGILESKLSRVDEDSWPFIAADAEEAISREHTTWLASRTGRLPNWTSE